MNNIVLTNNIRYDKHVESDLFLFNKAASMSDVDVVAYEDMAVGIYNGEPFMRVGDGRFLTKGDSELPRWIINHGAPIRILACLEALGITCLSSHALTDLAKDKIRSAMWLSGVYDMPDSLFYRGNIDVCDLPTKQSFMLKSIDGHCGEGVWKIDNPIMVASYDKKCASTQDDFLFLQQLMPSADDVRVYVLGDEIVEAVTREVPKGVWKSNLTSKPTQKIYQLSDEQREMIQRGIDILPGNRGFFTIDFLFGEEGQLVFCEMNTGPGYNALRNLGKEEEIVDKYFAYAYHVSKQ